MASHGSLGSLRARLAKKKAQEKTGASGSRTLVEGEIGADHSSSESFQPDPKRQRVEEQSPGQQEQEVDVSSDPGGGVVGISPEKGRSRLSRRSSLAPSSPDVEIMEMDVNIPKGTEPYGHLFSEKFPFPEFIDRELCGPEVEFDIGDESFTQRLQWAERSLLRTTALIRVCEKFSKARDEAEKEKMEIAKKLVLEKDNLKLVSAKLEDAEKGAEGYKDRAEKAEGELKTALEKVTELQKDNDELGRANSDLATVVSDLTKAREELSVKVTALEDQAKQDLEDSEKLVDDTFSGIMAQVRLLAPEIDFSAVGPFNTVQDGKIVALED